jgi:hypothetical protein
LHTRTRRRGAPAACSLTASLLWWLAGETSAAGMPADHSNPVSDKSSPLRSPFVLLPELFLLLPRSHSKKQACAGVIGRARRTWRSARCCCSRSAEALLTRGEAHPSPPQPAAAAVALAEARRGERFRPLRCLACRCCRRCACRGLFPERGASASSAASLAASLLLTAAAQRARKGRLPQRDLSLSHKSSQSTQKNP